MHGGRLINRNKALCTCTGIGLNAQTQHLRIIEGHAPFFKGPSDALAYCSFSKQPRRATSTSSSSTDWRISGCTCAMQCTPSSLPGFKRSHHKTNNHGCCSCMRTLKLMMYLSTTQPQLSSMRMATFSMTPCIKGSCETEVQEVMNQIHTLYSGQEHGIIRNLPIHFVLLIGCIFLCSQCLGFPKGCDLTTREHIADVQEVPEPSP